jgi:periplasmic protein TonB
VAYIDRHSNQHRTPILAVIGVIHVGVIYALITGLAGIVPGIMPKDRTEGANIPVVPTAPDTPKPDERPIVQPQGGRVQTQPAGPVMPEGPITVTLGSGPILGGGLGPIGPIEPIPTPAAEPGLTPKLARPIGRPGLWVTPNDYPAADLRGEHEGITRFQVSIGTDGKVLGCEITVSSGFASLDAAACSNVRKRAKFNPATDSTGAAVPGSYASAVRWTIPKD